MGKTNDSRSSYDEDEEVHKEGEEEDVIYLDEEEI